MPLRCAALGLLAFTLLYALAGCGQSQLGVCPARVDQHPGSGWPAFPPSESVTPVRQTSDSTFVALGDAFAEQSVGSASYADGADAGAYVLVPAKGGTESASRDKYLAWARYSFSALTGDRPVRLSIDAAAAPAQAGGSPPLPLQYYVGLSNYTQYKWEWRGPYTGIADVQLNAPAAGGSPALSDRYVSAAGVLHCVILVDTAGAPATLPGNSRGLLAAKVRSLTVTTAPGYVTNKPHFVLLDSVTVGPGHGGSRLRSASALMPEQYVHVEWTPVAPFGAGDAPSAAKLYRIFRQSKDDGSVVQVGEQTTAGFIDPVDALPTAPAPNGGLSYRYMVQAVNDSGETPLNTSAYVLIPLFTPLGLTATLDSAEDGIRLNWQAVDGALAYEVWRGETNDPQYAGLIATVDAPTTTYLDTTAKPATIYYFWVRALGQSGEASPFSGAAVGLRRVLVAITCLTSGVTGSGLQFDPFLLDPANTYLMGAHDQVGTDITFWVDWSVIPSSAASFSSIGLQKNQLQDIQPGAGLFRVQAKLVFQTYSWTGEAYCQAQ